MRPSVGLAGLLLVLAPAVLAQNNPPPRPNQPNDPAPAETDKPETTDAPQPTASTKSEDKSTPVSSAAKITAVLSTSSDEPSPTANAPADTSIFHISNAPTIAGVGIPTMVVPNTAGAPYMQKSNLPDGTVFICVGAALGFLGFAVLAWRGMVAWSLHRSVKRAAQAQNVADMKAMTTIPGGKKRGMYNVVGASSNMSLDRLSAAPTGTSRPPKPFAQAAGGTPPRSQTNLFFSPTAGGGRDSMVNRSSTYLPAGYYPTGNAQAASGSPVTQVGGHGAHLSTHSLATPGNRFSHRSGVSPPISPSLPPSRGYDRAPPSRDGMSMYNRNSTVSPASPQSRGNMYAGDQGSVSQLSLNVPGGNTQGGRTPSTYLEDLFENHGNGPRERF